jgi:hypothetical protein
MITYHFEKLLDESEGRPVSSYADQKQPCGFSVAAGLRSLTQGASMKKAFLATLALSTIGYAESVPGSGWTGFYMVARGRDLAGLNVVNPDLAKTVFEHLQPWAKLKMEATNGVADDTGAVCLAHGILAAVGSPFSGNFLMIPQRDKVIMAFWEINTSRVRRIYLNRQHPENLLPSWNGDSIGHWEGDTLIVDTIGFNDQSWLSGNMTPHTEQTHLTERMRQIEHDNNRYIELVGKVEDRQALTSAYTYTRYYKNQNRDMDEHVCAEDLTQWKHWRNEALKKEYDRATEVK